MGTEFRVYGVRFRVEQRIDISSTPAALDSPLTSADASGIRVHSPGFSVQCPGFRQDSMCRQHTKSSIESGPARFRADFFLNKMKRRVMN